MTTPELYEKDFYLWAMTNAELLRQGKLSEIDIENMAEEIEAMGMSQRRELESRLVVLIMHLLKWEYQSPLRVGSWKNTVNTQRDELRRLMKMSPSLKSIVHEAVGDAYDSARFLFEDETGISRKILPVQCPYTFEQAMDHEFWPE